jgi:hypothetical protein
MFSEETEEEGFQICGKYDKNFFNSEIEEKEASQFKIEFPSHSPPLSECSSAAKTSLSIHPRLH